jgi:hypothetical protein
MNWSDVMHFTEVTPIDVWNAITRTDFLIPNLYWVPVVMILLILIGSRAHRRRVHRNFQRRQLEEAAAAQRVADADAESERYYEQYGHYPDE